MKRKRIILAMFLTIMLLFVCIGFIKINIINTKALSPLGTSNDNYKIVSDEFGEEFSKFIKDNSIVKIYTGNVESKETLVKIGDYDLKIKDESELIKRIEYVFDKVSNVFTSAKDGIDEWTQKINNTEK